MIENESGKLFNECWARVVNSALGVSSLAISGFLVMLYLSEKHYRKEGRYGRGGERGKAVKLSKFESVALVLIKVVIGVLIFCIVFGSYDVFWAKHELDQLYLIAEDPFRWNGLAPRFPIETVIERAESQLYLELTVVMGFVGLTALIIVGLMLIKRMRTVEVKPKT